MQREAELFSPLALQPLMAVELLAVFGESLPAFRVLCTLADGFPAKLPHI